MGFVYAALAAVTWGLVYALDQKLLAGLSPMTLLFAASCVGLVLTLPFILWDLSEIRLVLRTPPTLKLLVLVEIFTCFASFFIFSSIKLLGASTASIFEISYPLFVVVFSLIIYGGTVNFWFCLGAAFLFIGSYIIIRWG